MDRMSWMTWSHWDWAVWGWHHPLTLLITPALILALYVASKIRNR